MSIFYLRRENSDILAIIPETFGSFSGNCIAAGFKNGYICPCSKDWAK